MLKLAQNLGSVCLLMTINSSGVEAAKTTAAAHSESYINAEISSMASSV